MPKKFMESFSLKEGFTASNDTDATFRSSVLDVVCEELNRKVFTAF
jgi:hypothetical protein